MKLVGIVGSNTEKSYNRLLLQFIEKQYRDLFEIEVLEIDDVPLFNQSDDQTNTETIQNLNRKILKADGVIISTPEHNRSISPVLKSALEWLSYKIHPFENKPVMVIGASYYNQGTSRAQLHLRQILESPGVGAYVFPGNEFLLGNVKEAFDAENNIKDQKTVAFLGEILSKFIRFVEIVSGFEIPTAKEVAPEDLNATGQIDTTIEGVDMYAEDWVEQAADQVNAVEGDTYIKLDRGILTVNQMNHFLNSMPMELTFADSNNQFLYYNYHLEKNDMLADRHPSQVGNPLAECHPSAAYKNVEWVIQQLRSGEMDTFRINVPTHGPDKFVVHNYKGIKDKDGNYIGINEYVHDLQPTIDWYLQQTGQELVGGHVDGISGASEADDVSSASQNTEPETVDAVSGASENS